MQSSRLVHLIEKQSSTSSSKILSRSDRNFDPNLIRLPAVSRQDTVLLSTGARRCQEVPGGARGFVIKATTESQSALPTYPRSFCKPGAACGYWLQKISLLLNRIYCFLYIRTLFWTPSRRGELRKNRYSWIIHNTCTCSWLTLDMFTGQL